MEEMKGMKEMRKPEVGDVLFLVDAGNRARYNGGKQRECIVSKVGRKYFYITLSANHIVQFCIEDWNQRTEYIADFILYESKEEWKKGILRNKYSSILQEHFRYTYNSKFTLEQLEQVIKILGIDTKE